MDYRGCPDPKCMAFEVSDNVKYKALCQGRRIYDCHLVNCELHIKRFGGGFADLFDELFATTKDEPFVHKWNSEHTIRILVVRAS
jgi:hypothetical protein